MENDLIKIYDLKRDQERVRQIQKATLETKDFGLVPDPALFGSPEWWQAIKLEKTPVLTIKGVISKVFMSGHNDFPEFEIDDGKQKTQWERRGIEEAYTVGRGVLLKYVIQKFKRSVPGLNVSKNVLEIWVSV
jgi:hypothetical protein